MTIHLSKLKANSHQRPINIKPSWDDARRTDPTVLRLHFELELAMLLHSVIEKKYKISKPDKIAISMLSSK